jgi:hypothetical protein
MPNLNRSNQCCKFYKKLTENAKSVFLWKKPDLIGFPFEESVLPISSTVSLKNPALGFSLML